MPWDRVHDEAEVLEHVISEELEELFTISDRLCVIAEGRVSPSVRPADTSIEQIGLWMSGKFDSLGEPSADALTPTQGASVAEA